MKSASRAAALLAALLLLTAVAWAQDFSPRRMGVVFRGGVPHLYFSAADLLNGPRGRNLEGGLPQRVVFTHTAFVAGARQPITLGGQSCRIVYDLWQMTYRVQRMSDRAPEERFALGSRQEVVEHCLVLRNTALGRRGDFRRGAALEVRSVVELNPLSSRTLARIRRWLARPGGGSALDDNAFFGSFVSLFVNQRIGSAERVLRLRSQRIVVP